MALGYVIASCALVVLVVTVVRVLRARERLRRELEEIRAAKIEVVSDRGVWSVYDRYDARVTWRDGRVEVFRGGPTEWVSLETKRVLGWGGLHDLLDEAVVVHRTLGEERMSIYLDAKQVADDLGIKLDQLKRIARRREYPELLHVTRGVYRVRKTDHEAWEAARWTSAEMAREELAAERAREAILKGGS
jgi:hypothetical protein